MLKIKFSFQFQAIRVLGENKIVDREKRSGTSQTPPVRSKTDFKKTQNIHIFSVRCAQQNSPRIIRHRHPALGDCLGSYRRPLVDSTERVHIASVEYIILNHFDR